MKPATVSDNALLRISSLYNVTKYIIEQENKFN